MPTTTTIPQPEPLPASPKRKRPAKEPHSGPFPSRLKTSHLPPRPRPRPPPPNISFHNSTQRPGSSSPRTAVAGNLQKLDLSASNEELTALDFSPSELPLDSHPSVTPFTSPAPGIVSANREGGEREVLEIPETPRLKPVKSSEQVELLLGAKRRGDEEGERPLDTGEKLWWSEGEITGHQLDVKDEGDDGEGINGVGFLPVSYSLAIYSICGPELFYHKSFLRHQIEPTRGLSIVFSV